MSSANEFVGGDNVAAVSAVEQRLERRDVAGEIEVGRVDVDPHEAVRACGRRCG